LEFLARVIREKQKIKGIQILKEEVKLSLFSYDIILYVKDPKNTTKKLLEIMNSFSKLSGYKINIEKSIAFLHTNKEQSEKEIREIIPFTIVSKIMKYF
jgi:hypothetical protein